MRRACGDHDAVGIGDDTTGSTEVARELDAQPLDPGRLDVSELRIPGGEQRSPVRAKPGVPREEADVGHVRAKVEPELGFLSALLVRRVTDRNAANARRSALPKLDVSLGGEHSIRPHDHAA